MIEMFFSLQVQGRPNRGGVPNGREPEADHRAYPSLLERRHRSRHQGRQKRFDRRSWKLPPRHCEAFGKTTLLNRRPRESGLSWLLGQVCTKNTF